MSIKQFNFMLLKKTFESLRIAKTKKIKNLKFNKISV